MFMGSHHYFTLSFTYSSVGLFPNIISGEVDLKNSIFVLGSG